MSPVSEARQALKGSVVSQTLLFYIGARGRWRAAGAIMSCIMCAASGPCCCRYLISQHPEVEAKLVAELDAAGLLVAPGRPQPRPMEYADLGRLTYLSWVCKVCSLLSSYPNRAA